MNLKTLKKTIPSNLNEAVQILKDSMQPGGEKDFHDSIGLHFGFGMWLRNNWHLWERETPLVQWFAQNLGIIHADDVSGTILEALSADLEKREFDPKKHAQKYIEYWKSTGYDPMKETGK